MRLIGYLKDYINSKISIHAPLTGCDVNTNASYYLAKIISIHAPLTGCDDIQF